MREERIEAAAVQTEGEKKLLGMLGLAARARKLLCGTELVCGDIRQNAAAAEGKGGKDKSDRVRLVLIVSDASENTRKRIVNCCTYYGVPHEHIAVSGEIAAQAVGKNKGNRGERARVSVIGIRDENFTKAIHTIISEHADRENAGTKDPL